MAEKPPPRATEATTTPELAADENILIRDRTLNSRFLVRATFPEKPIACSTITEAHSLNAPADPITPTTFSRAGAEKNRTRPANAEVESLSHWADARSLAVTWDARVNVMPKPPSPN